MLLCGTTIFSTFFGAWINLISCSYNALNDLSIDSRCTYPSSISLLEIICHI